MRHGSRSTLLSASGIFSRHSSLVTRHSPLLRDTDYGTLGTKEGGVKPPYITQTAKTRVVGFWAWGRTGCTTTIRICRILWGG